ncbi:non-canonical purine NTP pyrophosphatase [Candidatus Peregrinibacteria bacterium]|nr:non-canonical purine NTP pyrophosphatase [Candidatus Peregrinibacteria bacterium]
MQTEIPGQARDDKTGKKKLLIATGNKGKYKEIMEVLHDLEGFEFVSLADLHLINDAEEDGKTYEENSLKKAKHFFKKIGLITLSEDSGIEIEALKDELGVKTRRWGAGENASDKEWLVYFLERMRHEKNKRAKFICVSTIMWAYEGHDLISGVARPRATHKMIQFRGETWGTLLDSPQCEIPHGIPISSVFLPDGEKEVYAVLSPHEKNKISHRGKAMHEVKKFLEEKFSVL